RARPRTSVRCRPARAFRRSVRLGWFNFGGNLPRRLTERTTSVPHSSGTRSRQLKMGPIDDMAKTTGAWLRSGGPMSDVVISSRIRLARNVKGFPFLAKAGETERKEIYRTLTDRI